MLIWDLNYNALLASRSQPIPPSVCRDGVSNIMVDLSSAGPSQAILVLSTPSNYKYLKGSSSDLSRESVILNIPYVVPSRSSLSSVVGKGDAARDWLAPSATSDVPKELAGAIVNPDEATVIKRMNQILSRNHDEEGFRKADEVVMDYLQDLFDRDKRTKLSSLVSHEFVSAILRILLPPPPSPTGNLLKTPPTVTKLISQGAISQIQLLNEGGVVGILRQRNDWVAIGTCLKHIPDISEDILVQLLHDVVAAHLSTTVDTSDGMDVDRPAQPRAVSIPPLSSFLESTMAYPTSSQALRIALRKHLKFSKAEEEAKSKKPASAPLDKDQWMTRRNQRRGAAELNIGDYQVEDLVF
ncbi:hypothetical protein FRC03_006584 [Tulasnella sp. 419]|nr:hypothetical protein FRC03_006584 [Tulasnella sp. 419]